MIEYPNGTVQLYKPAGNETPIEKIGNWGQKLVTRSPYVHGSLYLANYTHEFTNGGYNKTPGCRKADAYLIPRDPLTAQDVEDGLDWINKVKRRPYNYPVYLSMLIVYPTKEIWRALGWIPFSNKYVWGYECYWFIDDFYRHGLGRDLFPDDPETYTISLDFFDTPKLLVA